MNYHFVVWLGSGSRERVYAQTMAKTREFHANNRPHCHFTHGFADL